MSARTVKDFPLQPNLDFDKKPLQRTQEVLKQTKVCVVLAREVLVEFKDLVVVLGLIAFLVWGFLQLLHRLH
jgi:hypothetical protein